MRDWTGTTFVAAIAAATLMSCGGAHLNPSPERVPEAEPFPALRTPDVDPWTPAEHAPVLISGATLMIGDGTRVENGGLLMEAGRISWVGEGHPETLPDNVTVVDAQGLFVTPGLIDTHSHLGVYPSPSVAAHWDGNEATSPTTPEVDAEHSIWPQDPGFERALAGGTTTLQILPGSANLIGGRSATVKVRDAIDAADMRFPDAPIGLKMACGENPKRVYKERGGPSTRMGSVARMRAAFQDAQAYVDSWDKYREAHATWAEEGAKERERPDPPRPDLGKATLAGVLTGDILVHVHCYRADEMLTQIALAEEFGYSIRNFHHAVEAYKIRDVLAGYDIGVSTWADWWGFKIEAWDAIPEAAGLIARDSGRTIIHSDSAIGVQRLNQEAAKALYRAQQRGVDGLTEDEALRWITSNPAWSLGIDAQTGTLEVGKMADVVLWDGNPFSFYAAPLDVYVDGVLGFSQDRADEAWSDFESTRGGLELLSGSDAPAFETSSVTIDANAFDSSGALVLDDVRIFTLDDADSVVERGRVVIDGGEIRAVGATASMPEGATVLSLPGASVTAGFFDVKTGVGLTEIWAVENSRDANSSGTLRPSFDVLDAYNPDSEVVKVTRAEGVTDVVVHPSGGILPGRARHCALGDGSARAMCSADIAMLDVVLGARGARAAGGSRAEAWIAVRDAFDDAARYAAAPAAYESNAMRRLTLSKRDLDALSAATAGTVPALVSVERASDIESVVWWADEVGMKVVLDGAAGAVEALSALERTDIPVVLNPLSNLPSSFETMDRGQTTAARLSEMGVPVALSTGDTHNVRNLRQVAGNAVRAGMPWMEALDAVTRTPAELAGVGDELGRVAPGYRANIVVWSGDPLDASGRAVLVFIGGEGVSPGGHQHALYERYRAPMAPIEVSDQADDARPNDEVPGVAD